MVYFKGILIQNRSKIAPEGDEIFWGRIFFDPWKTNKKTLVWPLPRDGMKWEIVIWSLGSAIRTFSVTTQWFGGDISTDSKPSDIHPLCMLTLIAQLTTARDIMHQRLPVRVFVRWFHLESLGGSWPPKIIRTKIEWPFPRLSLIWR